MTKGSMSNACMHVSVWKIFLAVDLFDSKHGPKLSLETC